MSRLLSYSGVRSDHWGADGKGGHTISTYGAGASHHKTYSFNTAGFRGEDLLPDAAMRLFVGGCSFTFGHGLDIEETWPYKFKLRVAARTGCDPSRINLLNFSQGGASNDYIA